MSSPALPEPTSVDRAFQQMIEAATSQAKLYDVVLVHSMSRFFRDQLQSELCIRRLRRAGVEVLSVAQAFADDQRQPDPPDPRQLR
jgi:DNA invertase Pin-like site-specific DNA recombinase